MSPLKCWVAKSATQISAQLSACNQPKSWPFVGYQPSIYHSIRTSPSHANNLQLKCKSSHWNQLKKHSTSNDNSSHCQCTQHYRSVCLLSLSSRACAFICCTSIVSALRLRMYSSWLPMHSARMRLLIRSRSAKNTKSCSNNIQQ